MSSLQPLTSKTQSSLSTEPLYVNVSAQVPGSASPEDVSADTVKFAFKTPGVAPDAPPSGADWLAGAIVTETTQTNQTIYLAWISVGPNGTAVLAPGTYVVWIYLDDELGQPVAQVGELIVTEL